MPSRRKNIKKASVAPAVLGRVTRARAASEGLEVLGNLNASADGDRRSRKASKSSQESISVIAETVELVDTVEESRAIPEAIDSSSKSSSSSNDSGSIIPPSRDVPNDIREGDGSPSSPLIRKTPLPNRLPPCAPDNMSPAAHYNAALNHASARQHPATSHLVRDFFKSDPTTGLSKLLSSPCLSSVVAVASFQSHQSPESPSLGSINPVSPDAARDTVITAPVPVNQPPRYVTSKKRPQPIEDSSASDSEDDHDHVVSFYSPLLNKRRSQHRIRNMYLHRNSKEEAARRVRMQRIEDFNREQEVLQAKDKEPQSKRRKTSTHEAVPVPTQAVSLEQVSPQPLLTLHHKSEIARPNTPGTKSAPTSPFQHNGLITPLLSKVTKLFNWRGTQSAAAKPQNTLALPTSPAVISPPHVLVTKPDPTNEKSSDEFEATPSKSRRLLAGRTPHVARSRTAMPSSQRRPLHARFRKDRKTNIVRNPDESTFKSSSPLFHGSEYNTSSISKLARLDRDGANADTSLSRNTQREEDMEPESDTIIGNKRKVGRTFSVPEYPDSEAELSCFDSAKYEDEAPSVTAYSTSGTKPVNLQKKSGGRTFAMPENTLFNGESEISHGKTEIPFEIKPLIKWTNSDVRDYMKVVHDWDPQALADQVEDLQRGILPPMFVKARAGIREMHASAQAEVLEEMRQLRERGIVLIQREVDDKRRELSQLEMKLDQTSRVLSEHGQRGKDNQPVQQERNVQPGLSKNRPTANIFAVARAQIDMPASSSDRSFNASPDISSDISLGTCPHPSLSTSIDTYHDTSLKSSSAHNSRHNVGWTENKENHITSPGPNEPPCYSGAPPLATKSALKASVFVPNSSAPAASVVHDDQTEDGLSSSLQGHQLQSFARKMHDAQKYNPKKPSRLREVSRISSSPLVGMNSLMTNHAVSNEAPASGDESSSDAIGFTPATNYKNISSIFPSPNVIEAFELAGRQAALEVIKGMKVPSLFTRDMLIDLSAGIPAEELATRSVRVVAALTG